jgi:Skp family chaperone for outer membrane proteins
MKRSVMTVVVVGCLGGASAFAQAPAAARPAQPAPAAPAAAPAPPAPQPLAPPAPFPQGAKVGFVNLQQIAALSADGKAANAKVQALIQKKQTEAAEKEKALQGAQQKLQSGGTLLSEAARAQLEKDVEKMQVDSQRFQQDAQAEITDLQQQLQNDFQKKLFPILQQMAQEKGLHVLLSLADVGAIWWDPGLDLTGEAIKKFDTVLQPAAGK